MRIVAKKKKKKGRKAVWLSLAKVGSTDGVYLCFFFILNRREMCNSFFFGKVVQ